MSINQSAFLEGNAAPATAPAALPKDRNPGALIKRWRERRHLSQKDLATAADVSCRHISFIETGRSKASRKMVLRLCEVLDLPYRSRNLVLEAHGFKPAFTEAAPQSENFKAFARVVDGILGRNEPFPSVAVDGGWNVIKANESARKLFSFLLGEPVAVGEKNKNILRWLVDEAWLRQSIANWEEVAVELIRTLHKKIEASGADRGSEALLEGLIGTLAETSDHDPAEKATGAATLAAPVVIKRAGMTMSFLASSLAFEGPKDITAQEMRILTLHPTDQDSEEALRFLSISRL